MDNPSNFSYLTWQMFISYAFKIQGRVVVLSVVTQQSRLFPSYGNSISIHGLRGHPEQKKRGQEESIPTLNCPQTNGTTDLFCL